MNDRPWRVELAPAAQRQLRRLPPGDAARLRGPILALGHQPRPPGATKLVGSEFWRLRLAGLRVVCSIDDRRRLVIVLRVARRAESTSRRLGSLIRPDTTGSHLLDGAEPSVAR